MVDKNTIESRRLAKAVRAKQRQCFYNAFKVIHYVAEYSSAVYVEGYAVTSYGLAFEHGWIEFKGEILDPTLPEQDLAYFPGLRWTGERGIAEALRIPKDEGTTDFPIFIRFGWGGQESPEFMAARNAAWNFVSSMATEPIAEQREPLQENNSDKTDVEILL